MRQLVDIMKMPLPMMAPLSFARIRRAESSTDYDLKYFMAHAEGRTDKP